MENKLTEEQLNKLLPALSLLAEDVGAHISINPNSLKEVLLNVNAEKEEWAIKELELWSKILQGPGNNPANDRKTATIAELMSRGVPEFPAMLAIYVATNQQPSTPKISSIPKTPIPTYSVPSKKTDLNKPIEPYHKLLPDHGWHNDLTWDLLPDWIKNNPQLIARLKRGEQVVGKNVRYRFVANRLIRRLRDRITVAHKTVPQKTFTNIKPSLSIIDNTQLLRDLIEKKTIRLCDSPILKKTPAPLPISFDFRRVEGMLLGIAIGDALGATSEGMKPPQRHKTYGEIRDYQADRRDGHHRQAGVGTDDTQLSFWTVEQLISDHGLRPDSLANKFCGHHIWGIGSTVKRFVENYKDKHLPWYETGTESLGNGALMRIAPIILPYLRNPHTSMLADAAIACMITHNDFANNASSVAFVEMLWQLLSMNSIPEPTWWIDTYCDIAKELEGNTKYHRTCGTYGDYSGSLWNFTSTVCKDALKKKLPVEKACNIWGSGANLFETVPSVLYILATCAKDPEEAIIRAVNDTVDNDSVASIVGAAVGALHGLNGIPNKWIKQLNGRVRSGRGEENQVFNLIAQSKIEFW